MEAPRPQENINLIIENDNKKYNLLITNSLNTLIINISVDGDKSIIKKEYSKEYTLKDLSKNSKFFKLFDDISAIIVSLKETFENKKPKIKEEENNYIELTIVPILSAIGETTLIIPMKKSNDKEIINNLCNIITKKSNDIKNLQLKVSTLEERVNKLEQIIFKKSLIGDIITNEEQYNLICNWINKDKELNFKLIYKGTRDGDTLDIFHLKCDNQGPTIILIESKDKQIFGGYTTKSWKINNKITIPDPDSFLFNINLKKKYCASNNRGIINDYICNFGDNSFYELWVCNNFLSEYGGCDNGKGYNFINYELTGGKSVFKIKELEVYKVIES